MKKNITTLMAISIFFVLIACTEASQKESSQTANENKVLLNFPSITAIPKHKVMVLGSFHFDRTTDGSDVISKNHIDINSIENQAQLDSLISLLKEFNPTRIALEWTPEAQPKIDSLYNAYRQGDWELGKNESFQIGFRLAKLLNHPKVHCIDNRPPMPETVTEVDDWDVYAEALNQKEIWHSYDKENDRFNSYVDSLQNELFVLDYLKVINAEVHAKRTKQLWVTGLVNLGVHSTYLGADLTGHWYRRNTRIFVNARNLVELEHETVLIIYGAGHKWILDELFEASPEFEVQQLNQLLEK